MKIQTGNQVQIGNINYFTELSGDAPISVYVITAVATHFFVIFIKGQIVKQRENSTNNVANDSSDNL